MADITPRRFAVVVFPLILGAFLCGSALSESEIDTGACKYWPAYGTVIEAGSGREVNVGEASTVVTAAIDCAVGLMSDVERDKFIEQRQIFDTHAVVAIVDLKRQLIYTELAASISEDEGVADQRLVTRRMLAKVGAGDVNEIVDSLQAEKFLKANGWVRDDPSDNNKAFVEKYQANCLKSGVPIPPPLGSGDWVGPVPLSSEVPKYFILQDRKRVELFYIKIANAESDGFCVAMDRAISDADQQPLIGTICANKDQTQACFFDNLKYSEKSGPPVRLTREQTKITEYKDLIHPADAKDKCKRCHIGQNPFVVHPQLELGRNILALYQPNDRPKPDPYAKPDSRSNFEFVDFANGKPWTNKLPMDFAGPAPKTEGTCMLCHNLPQLQKSTPYCTQILYNAAIGTMPPDHSGSRNSSAGRMTTRAVSAPSRNT